MRFSSKDVSVFYHQMATLIAAGVPIQQTLKSLSKSAPYRMRSTVNQLSHSIQQGISFHEAIGTIPKSFSKLDQQILGLCEKSGALDTGLFSLGKYYEKCHAARRMLISELILPTLQFVAAIFIIPMPKLILGNISASDYLRDTVGFLFWLALGLVTGFLLCRWILKNSLFSVLLDQLLHLIPIFGRFRANYALSQWIQSIRLMLNAGFGVIQAMEFASKTVMSPRITQAYQRARPLMNSQLDVSQALESTGIFPNMMIQFWATGEQSGRMDEMLQKLADYYDEEWPRNLKSLTRVIARLIYFSVIIFIAIQILTMATAHMSTINNILNEVN